VTVAIDRWRYAVPGGWEGSAARSPFRCPAFSGPKKDAVEMRRLCVQVFLMVRIAVFSGSCKASDSCKDRLRDWSKLCSTSSNQSTMRALRYQWRRDRKSAPAVLHARTQTRSSDSLGVFGGTILQIASMIVHGFRTFCNMHHYTKPASFCAATRSLIAARGLTRSPAPNHG